MLRIVNFIVAIINFAIVAWAITAEHPLYHATAITETQQLLLYLLWDFFSLLLLLFMIGDADTMGAAGDLASFALWAFGALLIATVGYLLFADFPVVNELFRGANWALLGVLAFTALIVSSVNYDKKPIKK